MKKEKIRAWLLNFMKIGYILLCLWLFLDMTLGNANILTDTLAVGELRGPEFNWISVYGVKYERGEIPDEVRKAGKHFIGYVSDGKHAMKISSFGYGENTHYSDYLHAGWGYDGFTYRRVEN